jgi:M6 family metalloprotease-like protein
VRARRERRVRSLLVLTTLVATLSCAGGDSPSGPDGSGEASVTLSQSTANLAFTSSAAAQVQLTATVTSATGTALPGAPVTWTSSNTAAATVSSTGLVSAVEPGSATIRAPAMGKFAEATVTVLVPTASSVVVTPATMSLALGQAAQLTATVRDATGQILEGETVTWTSGAGATAIVTSTGLLVSNGVGDATITAAAIGVGGSAAVTITAAPPRAACILPALTGSVSFGFPRSSNRLPATGDLRLSVALVDFPDAGAFLTPEEVFGMVSPGAEAFFDAMSYGALNMILTPDLQWRRMSQPSTAYGFQTGITFNQHRSFLEEALLLATPSSDFSQAHGFVVLTNPTEGGVTYGPAFVANSPGNGITVDGNTMLNGTNSGRDLSVWGSGWLNHELGHTLGLPDLYDYSPAGLSAHHFVGEFSSMGLISGRAPEWTAWERWQLGWVNDGQIYCAPSGRSVAALTPVALPGGQKAVVVPTGTSSAMVIESRRAIGYDTELPKPGLLVYLIDTSIQSGRGTMQVLPIADTDASKLNRTLAAGQSLTHGGVTVRLLSTSTAYDLVEIVRP